MTGKPGIGLAFDAIVKLEALEDAAKDALVGLPPPIRDRIEGVLLPLVEWANAVTKAATMPSAQQSRVIHEQTE